jgi:hypothetical protein
MANAIPMLGGTDASGGYLIRDEFGAPLRTPSTASRRPCHCPTSSRSTPTARSGRCTPAARPPRSSPKGAAKGVTGAEFTQLAVDVKKMATIVLYTEEVLEDASSTRRCSSTRTSPPRSPTSSTRTSRLRRPARRSRRTSTTACGRRRRRWSTRRRTRTRSRERSRPRSRPSRATVTTRTASSCRSTPSRRCVTPATRCTRRRRLHARVRPRARPAVRPRAAVQHEPAVAVRVPPPRAVSSASSATSPGRWPSSARASRCGRLTRRPLTCPGRCITCGSRTRRLPCGRCGWVTRSTTATAVSWRSSTPHVAWCARREGHGRWGAHLRRSHRPVAPVVHDRRSVDAGR